MYCRVARQAEGLCCVDLYQGDTHATHFGTFKNLACIVTTAFRDMIRRSLAEDGECNLQEVEQNSHRRANARNARQGFCECTLVHWEPAVRPCLVE
jgi:hypothetical protein